MVRGTARKSGYVLPDHGRPPTASIWRARRSCKARWTSLRARTGRSYKLFDYYGDEAAERVIVLMGSGAQTAMETVDHLVRQGEKVGVLAVQTLPAVFGDPFHRGPSKNRKGRLPCSIARRKPAPWVNRSTSMSSLR